MSRAHPRVTPVAILVAALALMAAFPARAVQNCPSNIPASTPSADFTDNNDGTVTHVKTGLTWQRCLAGQTWDGSTCTGGPTTHNWGAALNLGFASSFAGHADWRLPNVKELLSIIETGCGVPAINLGVFPGQGNDWVWSSTPFSANPSDALVVAFDAGTIGNIVKTLALPVRLVRDGKALTAFDRLADYTPDTPNFPAQANVMPSSTVTSAAVTLAGLTTPTGIKVSNGTYSINGGAYTAAPGAVRNGDTLRLRHTAAATLAGMASTSVTVGGVSASFSSATPVLPGAPGITGVEPGVGQATVSFTAPNAGSQPITGYTVVSNPAGGIDAQAGTTATRHTLTGLTDGVSYSFTVIATSGAGNGPASAPSGPVLTGVKTIAGGGSQAVVGAGAWVLDSARSAGFIAASGNPNSPGSSPRGVVFPHGLLDFTLTGGAPGAAATLTLSYSAPLPANAEYWKYGPTASNPASHWYQLPPSQALFVGNTVTLTIIDGGLGDDDLTANGTIVDAGGPGVVVVQDIPSLSSFGAAVLSLLLASLALFRGRRGGLSA